jgi:hypothetical protein
MWANLVADIGQKHDQKRQRHGDDCGGTVDLFVNLFSNGRMMYLETLENVVKKIRVKASVLVK